MNQKRREKIIELAEKLDDLRIDLEAIRDEEQEAYDNLPESLQLSDKAADMQTVVDTLTECVDQLDDLAQTLEEVAAW